MPSFSPRIRGPGRWRPGLLGDCSFTVAAVAGGTVLAANAMFISSHDLGALAVVLVAGATLGVFIALLLGGRISRESRSLAAVARRIGDGDFTVENGPPPSAEFAALARELEEM